jgi:hypothetical protein
LAHWSTLRRAGSAARRQCRLFSRWSPRRRPPNRTCEFPRIRLSMSTSGGFGSWPTRAACAGSEVPAPAPPRRSGAERRCSPATSLRPTMPRAHWTPSPCGRLSRPPRWRVTATTTTGPPPRPGGNSGRCACPEPKARRAPPGRFPRSPSTGRQGRRPAVPRGHRRALPQHGPRPRPPDQQASGRDSPERQPGPSTPTAHSRQFRGCCPVSGLQALVRLLRLSALLPHPARWRRTVARSSGAAPALRLTSGLRLPLSFSRPLRRPGARPLTPPGHMAPRGAVLSWTRTGSGARNRRRSCGDQTRAAFRRAASCGRGPLGRGGRGRCR